MTIDAAGYVSTATWVPNARNGGGTYDPEGFGYRWRIVLHTIEGGTSPSVIAAHAYPPHLWYNPATRQLWQTVPLSRSAFALYQDPNAPHYTNRARALQVEIAGYAAQTATWPQQWLDNLTVDVIVPLCRWVASQGGMIDLLDAPDPGPIPNSARPDAPQRLTATRWATGGGLYSHRHVPMGDDHWDTGYLDTPRIAAHAAYLIGGQLDQTPGRIPATEEDVPIIVQLNQPGDPQHMSMWETDGLLKRRLDSMAEVDRLLASGACRKQPNGAGWAVWDMSQLRTAATVDEWSFAGLPDAVAGAVAGRLDAMLADLPNRIAMAVRSALVDQPSTAS